MLPQLLLAPVMGITNIMWFILRPRHERDEISMEFEEKLVVILGKVHKEAKDGNDYTRGAYNELKALLRENTVMHYAVEAQIEGYLLGKVLTVIDASYGDSPQGNAVKSLIKEKFHSQVDWLLQRRTSVESGSSADENEE